MLVKNSRETAVDILSDQYIMLHIQEHQTRELLEQKGLEHVLTGFLL